MIAEKMLFSINTGKNGKSWKTAKKNHPAACSRDFLMLPCKSFPAPQILRV